MLYTVSIDTLQPVIERIPPACEAWVDVIAVELLSAPESSNSVVRTRWDGQVMKTKRRRSRAPNKEKPIDWSNAKRVRLPNLKPSTQSMSLRPPGHTLEPITAAANARSVP